MQPGSAMPAAPQTFARSSLSRLSGLSRRTRGALLFAMIFALAGVGYLVFSHADTGWSSWENLGGAAQSAPASVSWGTNRIDLFTRGSNNAVYDNSYNGSSWSGWENLGGATYSAPSVSSWGSGRLDLFVRGTDNAIYHKYYQNGNWSSWENLGGATYSAPSVSSWGSGRLDLFVRGTDNAIYHKYYQNGNWSGWQGGIGGVTLSAPAAVSSGTGKIDLFVRGTDNGIYSNSWNGTAWLGWQYLGGTTYDAPAVSSWGAGRLDLFIRGTDNAIYHKYYSSGINTTLYAGQQLSVGQSIQSPNGLYKLILQSDGNLVVYNTANQTSSQAIWNSGTAGTSPAYLAMQTDGNLVEYNTAGQAVWRTWTDGSGSGNRLNMQNDGDLVMYSTNYNSISSTAAVWSSQGGIVNTTLHAGQQLTPGQYIESGNGQYRLYLQGDGNVVVYNTPSGAALWNSGTNGISPGSLFMQSNGDLEEYNSSGQLVWYSRTDGSGSGSFLTMQNDGDLVIHDVNSQLIWDTYRGVVNTTLRAGQQLTPGQFIESANGLYRLYLQGDGNVVLYNTNNWANATWNSGTNGISPGSLFMQSNGDLEEYNSSGQLVWYSRTDGSGSGSFLTLRDDGNLVIYNANGQPIWSTSGGVVNTTLQAGQQLTPGQFIESHNGLYRLYLQGDGNVVLYNTNNWANATWDSGTYGTSPGSLVMQGDGNFVEYSSSGQPIWYTGTDGMGGSYVLLQDDGDLVMYTANSTPVWSSQTGVISPSTVVPAGTLGAYPSTIQSNARSVLKGTPPGTMTCYVNNVYLGIISGTATYTTSQLPPGTNTYQMWCKPYCAPGNYCNDYAWVKTVTITILQPSPPPPSSTPAYSGPSGPVTQVVFCTQYNASNGCSGSWVTTAGGDMTGYATALKPIDKTASTDLATGAFVDDTSYCPSSVPQGTAGTYVVSASGQPLILEGPTCVQDDVTITYNYYCDPNRGNINSSGVCTFPIYAAVPPSLGGGGAKRFTNATALLEWYPNLGSTTPSTNYTISGADCTSAQGYIVERYLSGQNSNTGAPMFNSTVPVTSGTNYNIFTNLWLKAAKCGNSPTKTMAWY